MPRRWRFARKTWNRKARLPSESGAVELGRFGVRKSGNASAEKLNPERSKMIARKEWEVRSERNAEKSDFRSGPVVLARSNGTLMGRTRSDVVVQGV